MATTKVMPGPRDDAKSNYFHQTIELHLDVGTEVLRRVLTNELEDKMGISFTDYLNKRQVSKWLNKLKQKKILHQPQWDLLYPSNAQEPSVNQLDTTLLTMFLRDKSIPLPSDVKGKIKSLGDERNFIAHLPKAELNDKTHFNVTSVLVTELSSLISKSFTNDIKQSIANLHKREVVSCRSILDMISIRQEEFMVILIDRPDDKKVDGSDTTYLKFGLTKWAKQFARAIDLDTFLTRLKEDGIISYTEQLDIRKEAYNKEEQCGKLIMKVLGETKENLWKFCRCLRSVDDNLASLIENRADDGIEIESTLQDLEREKIHTTLQMCFCKDKAGKVTSEMLHLLVEKELGYSLPYSIIERVFMTYFDIAKSEYSFHGISLNDCGREKLESLTGPKNASCDEVGGNEECLSDKSCEELAKYLRKQCEIIKPGIGMEIQKGIIQECITPALFKDMTRGDIEECFTDYVSDGKIPFGIRKYLESVQKQINKETSSDVDEQVKLRGFDTVTDKQIYSKGQVMPRCGDLMVPAHEFRTLPDNENLTIPFIIKESIQFIAACLNSKQNGTIHFGIKGDGNGGGRIVGIDISNTSLASLNTCLQEAIDSCFVDDEVWLLRRCCLRLFQVVPVEDGSHVLEMDVIPFSDYTKTEFVFTHFPPKGKQNQKLFVYNFRQPCDIVTVPNDEFDRVRNLYKSIHSTRKRMEETTMKHVERTDTLTNNLVSVLTAGGDYVTDQYSPIICCGKITGCENETEIRKQFSVPEAFLSSVAVFDFDSSVNLRNQIEKQNTAFQVMIADDNISEEGILNSPNRIWMYCNGNEELNYKEMNLQDWYVHRSDVVKETIQICGKKAPRQRTIILFFVFSNCGNKDPFLELAESFIKSKFRDQCVIISESGDLVSDLKKKVSGIMSHDNLMKCFHTEMSWSKLSNTLRSVFRATTEHDYRLPCSSGPPVIMTAEEKRKLAFTDIDILSSDECERVREDIDKMQERKTKEQEIFYRGGNVTWWNFYYENQVVNRDLHAKFRDTATEILDGGNEHWIEVLKIRHQPGAGGTTAGKYLLWELSQLIKRRDPYRCCVIKQITEDTANQIYSFLSFADDSPKPVVILTDNENEDLLKLLLSRLSTLAYKHGTPGKLFCLHVEVDRVSVSYSKPNEDVLRHELSTKEQLFFKAKYLELEASEVKVETLISFNVMRKSFNKTYIKELADQFLSGVRETELGVLKCLSLLNTFNSDVVIPVSVFDCLVARDSSVHGKHSLWAYANKGPRGLVVPLEGKRKALNAPQIWNVELTNELALLIKRGNDIGNQSGVMIISQALAKAILDYIIIKEHSGLCDVVDFVLDIVHEHASERNPMSKEFVRVVNSLFKTRSLLNVKRETRTKFSDMVLALQHGQNNESQSEANMKVVELMERCFKITSDAMVGQQLARFFIYMNNFDKAEETIHASLDLKPKSSYLLSTYGQVYRHKMENIVNKSYHPINDDDTSKILEAGFNAIDKFVLGEKYGKTYKEMEDIDSTCSFSEVRTALYLLETFKECSCYENSETFLEFLNNPEFPVENSTFRNLVRHGAIEQLRKGSDTQQHVEESLRRLEEREYQIKRYSYTPDRYIDGLVYWKQLRSFRETFELFYGNKKTISRDEEFYVKGLKSLMIANEKHKDYLQATFDEIVTNLLYLEKGNRLEMADKSDLLIYLGYELIKMSDSEPKSTPMVTETYNRLLHYSDILLQRERTSSSMPYLEAFLYFALFHWPSESRLKVVDTICKPKKYMHMLEDWKHCFEENHGKKNRAKNFYALGKGGLGCDIVDLDECVRKKWIDKKQREENRKMRPVFGDHFWEEPFVVERMERLTGRTDATGTSVEYQINYSRWEYKLQIRTYYPCPSMGNRKVTFILGFTWGGLAAFNVKEIGKDRVSRQNTRVDDSIGKAAASNAADHNIRNGQLLKQMTSANDSVTRSLFSQERDVQSNTSTSKTHEKSKNEEVANESMKIAEMKIEAATIEQTQVEENAVLCMALQQTDKQDIVETDQDHPSKETDVTDSKTDKQANAETDQINRSLQTEKSKPVAGAEGGKSSTTGSRSESAAKDLKMEKNAVVLLNDRFKNLKYIYEEEKVQGRVVYKAWVSVGENIYEGKGQNKKQAKLEAAINALKDLKS